MHKKIWAQGNSTFKVIIKLNVFLLFLIFISNCACSFLNRLFHGTSERCQAVNKYAYLQPCSRIGIKFRQHNVLCRTKYHCMPSTFKILSPWEFLFLWSCKSWIWHKSACQEHAKVHKHTHRCFLKLGMKSHWKEKWWEWAWYCMCSTTKCNL